VANIMPDKARQAFLGGDLDWDATPGGGAGVKSYLIDFASWTPAPTTDQFLTDVPGAAIAATSAVLTTRTTTAGVADADDVTWSSVPTGPACEAVLLAFDTLTAATSRLIAVIDTATGLPVTPNGGDITVQWDSGANKIFKL
jgi:hypothetical protein